MVYRLPNEALKQKFANFESNSSPSPIRIRTNHYFQYLFESNRIRQKFDSIRFVRSSSLTEARETSELRAPTHAVYNVARIPGFAEQVKEWHAKSSFITGFATIYTSHVNGITIPATPRLRLVLTRRRWPGLMRRHWGQPQAVSAKSVVANRQPPSCSGSTLMPS